MSEIKGYNYFVRIQSTDPSFDKEKSNELIQKAMKDWPFNGKTIYQGIDCGMSIQSKNDGLITTYPPSSK